MAYSIDDVKVLTQQRANQYGATATIQPDQFNVWMKRAELKFFNREFQVYAQTQIVSDSISKWLTDPIYLPIDANGFFQFFTNMNLLHVDSMSTMLAGKGTSIGKYTVNGGGAYTDGTSEVALPGGTGTGAKANITATAGVAKVNYLTNVGTGYAVGNVLTITGGSGTVTINTLVGTKEYKVARVEKSRVAANLSSEYDDPNNEFAIYTQYANSFQFWPTNLGIAKTVYLKQPTPSLWAYTVKGNIGDLTDLIPGASYTDGTYPNVPLTGGTGTGGLATIQIAGGAAVTVNITNKGKRYSPGDVLSASSASIGGTGAGFTITIASILNGRAIYDPDNSIQPLWNDDDISTIVNFILEDVGIKNRDAELEQFAQLQSKSTQ